MKDIKKKKCRCDNCPNEFTPYKSTDKYCSRRCYLIDFTKKAIEDKVKLMKKEIKRNVFSDLQDEINTTIRLIDRGHQCITSEAPYGAYVVNAGHFFSVGSNPTLRYNLLNIFAQSQNDNSFKGGRGSNYGVRLKQVFGQEVRDEIESLPSKYKSLHLDKQQAQEAIKKVREINKRLRDDDLIFNIRERINCRKVFNQQIGIYK